MIDIHAHIGRLFYKQKGLTVETLLKFMDESGIEKACILPIENPEESHYYFTTKQVIEACQRSPRLIPFCNIDPRRGDKQCMDEKFKLNFKGMLEEYRRQGCVGFGEVLCGLAIDDERTMEIYKICQDLSLPVLIHIDHQSNYDEIGLPGLERLCQQFPNLTIICHAQGFWREISKEVNKDELYPKGRIIPGGRIDELLSRYPNLYADISADSGYHALTRDPEFTPGFIERNYSKLIFGTDILNEGQPAPIVEFIKNLNIDKEKKEIITRKNAEKLLNI